MTMEIYHDANFVSGGTGGCRMAAYSDNNEYKVGIRTNHGLRWLEVSNSHRDPSGYGLSQWETTLHCNVVSHWLSPYSELSLSPTGEEKEAGSYLREPVYYKLSSRHKQCLRHIHMMLASSEVLVVMFKESLWEAAARVTRLLNSFRHPGRPATEYSDLGVLGKNEIIWSLFWSAQTLAQVIRRLKSVKETQNQCWLHINKVQWH